MADITSVSVGYGVESAFGTPATPTRWPEFTEESLDYTPITVQGEGMRVGSRVSRSARHVIAGYDGGGGVTHEAFSKGLGIPLRAAFGTAVSTLVAGSTYQQNYTLGTAPSPLTIQKGVVQADGTVLPHTFAGAMCRSLEMSVGVSDIVKLAFDWDIRSMATATAYTAPTYVTGGSLFHFMQGAIVIGGTVTAPTTTALASGGTSVGNITGFTFNLDNGMGDARRAFGGAGLKTAAAVRGMATMTGTVTAELTDTVLRDAVLANTDLAMVLTFTSTEALSTGVASMSLWLPDVRFSGPMPQATGELVSLSLNYKAFDDLTASTPVTLSIRTADSAI